MPKLIRRSTGKRCSGDTWFGPVDYSAFDCRFIGEGLYLEELEGELLKVAVCVDTSGSVNQEQLGSFLGEVIEILRAYPHIEAKLFFADASLYGPHELDSTSVVEDLEPMGGGGTFFLPFYKWLDAHPFDPDLAIYLTDGFDHFPAEPPLQNCRDLRCKSAASKSPVCPTM